MAKGPEGKVQRRLKKDLEQLDNCYHFTKEALALRGIPDIIGCLNGKFFALEVKKSAKGITESRAVLQKWIISKIISAGGFASFIYPDNYDETISKLKDHACTK